MFDLVRLFSQYEIQKLAANHLSTLDLYHTALTCSTFYTLIAEDPARFQRLKRACLCDGKGLQPRLETERKNAKRQLYSIRDEESNACRLGLKCDETGARPCEKCSINVCNECRSVPREGGPMYGPCRRPHCTTTHERTNIICYCWDCDKDVEAKIQGEDSCDCDLCERWVCQKCAKKELEEELWYHRHRTEGFGGGFPDEDAYAGMMLSDHQNSRMVRVSFLLNCCALSLLRILNS